MNSYMKHFLELNKINSSSSEFYDFIVWPMSEDKFLHIYLFGF